MPDFTMDPGVSADCRRNGQPLRQQVSDTVRTLLVSATHSIVAANLGMTRSMLCRRLTDEGITFHQILKEVRRGVADDALASDAHSVAEIAAFTGYADQFSFSKAYKRWTGKPPGKARETLRHSRNQAPP